MIKIHYVYQNVYQVLLKIYVKHAQKQQDNAINVMLDQQKMKKVVYVNQIVQWEMKLLNVKHVKQKRD